MNYSHIIDEMTWSYSRITTYEDCPYRFLLTYIKNVKGKRQFFSDYGTFMHKIIQMFLTSELKKQELPGYYLSNFFKEVVGKAPTSAIFKNYFNQGLSYLKYIEIPECEILEVEKKIEFEIGDRNFVGYPDIILEADNCVIIVDNKSRTLKPRSTRKKPTKTDIELDNYLRQLYLYSIYAEKKFDKVPDFLAFNCFRNNTIIINPFSTQAYEKTKKWALDTINKITEEIQWNPKLDFFKCKYICAFCDQCEYFQMFNERRDAY